jgi:hypothetical protein
MQRLLVVAATAQIGAILLTSLRGSGSADHRVTKKAPHREQVRNDIIKVHAREGGREGAAMVVYCFSAGSSDASPDSLSYGTRGE